jgi:hypothetical protein
VYSGKALFGIVKHARANPDLYRGKRVLFWHTGGGFGLFDKAEQLAQVLPAGQVQRLSVAAEAPPASSL